MLKKIAGVCVVAVIGSSCTDAQVAMLADAIRETKSAATQEPAAQQVAPTPIATVAPRFDAQPPHPTPASLPPPVTMPTVDPNQGARLALQQQEDCRKERDRYIELTYNNEVGSIYSKLKLGPTASESYRKRMIDLEKASLRSRIASKAALLYPCN